MDKQIKDTLTYKESACNAEDEGSIRSRGREDPLEEEVVTHCSILAWEIPGQAGVHGVRHDWATNTCTFHSKKQNSKDYCVVGKDSWESLGLQGDQSSQS